MSTTIKIKSLKKGFKVSKIKVLPDEHYVIVDESGKTFDKLKFVQKDKNLEVYIEKDGKEEQIVILEDYYVPNMNASVVSLDTVTNQEIGYITQNDGWSYSSLAESSSMGILEYSAIGLGVIGAGIAIGGGGGGSSSSDETISTPEVQALTALEKIANYADSIANPAPTVQDYIDAGITGVDAANLNAVNAKVDAVAKVDADTVPEVQALADAGNITADTALAKIANYADDSTTNPAPTVQDYLDAGITGVTDATNVNSYLATTEIVGTNVDTVLEIQTLVNTVAKITALADGGIATGTALTNTDIINLGLSATINDVEELQLLNEVLDKASATSVDTASEVKNLASIVDRIATVAAGGTASPSLSAADFTAIGITDMTTARATDLVTKIAATADDGTGVDTLAEIQALVDTIAPSAPVINTIAGNDIINSSEQSSVITGTNEAGATVSLSIGGTTRAATVTGTTWSYTLVAADITAMGQGTETITATQTDAAGNVSTVASKTITVDTSAPVFSSSTSATTAENVSTSTVVYDANATDNAGAIDSGLLYSFVTTGGLDYSLFNINATNGNVTFKTSPDYENPTDNGSNNIYDFTVRATDTAGNYADKDVAVTVTDVYESPAGQSVIDLGAGNGKLINGVQVEGKWYYYWDKSEDGTNAGVDYTNHDLLDGIFNHDVNGATNTTVQNADGLYGTTDIYRYGTINGVSLALPTYGDTGTFSSGYKNGTAVSLNTTTENTTYDGLLAIWDSFNERGTGTNINGTPSGWSAAGYWSASPTSPWGHAIVNLNNGNVYNGDDTYFAYVAVEVL